MPRLNTYVLTAALAAAAAPGAAWAQQAAGDVRLQEVVVTAQKREQNLQAVPVAVTALTTESLQTMRFENLLNLSALAPGLSIRPAAGGVLGVSASMRGIYGLATIGQDQGVAFYVDGAYIAGTYGAAFDLANIERIEVLRGPQGTLFGRNSLGGAISVITRDPSGKFQVRQELSYGNYDQIRSKTRVDLPAFGPLSATLTYLHSERRGDIRNLGAGTRWDYSVATQGRYGVYTSPKYLGDQNVDAGSAAIKLRPSDALRMVYKVNVAKNNFTPNGEGPVNIDSGNATGRLVLSILAAQPNPAILSPLSAKRPKALNNAFATPGKLTTTDHNLTTIWQPNEMFSAKNILAYHARTITVSAELTGLGGLVAPAAPVVGVPVGAPYLLLGSNARYRDTVWSDEVQANINTERLTLTGGYLYYWNKSVGGNKPGALASLSFRTVPGFVLPFNNVYPSNVTTKSQAVYGQAEAHVTEQIDLQLGARWTKDRKRGVDRTFPGTERIIDYKGNKPTYLLGVLYRPVKGVLTYAKYTTGYVSGGQLSTLTYTSSTARSYEAGVKADWLDNRVRTNVAVYHVKYRSLQFLTSGLPFGIQANQVIFNGGDAKVDGFDVEASIAPMTGVTLSANVGYTDFRYTRVNPILGTTATVMPLFNPKWTGAFTAQYVSPEVVGGARVKASADAAYTSRQFVGRAGPTQAPGYFASSIVPRTWILNGRIALAGYETSVGALEVALWGRNLTDNRDRLGGVDFTFMNTAGYQPARTIGVDVTLEF